MQLVVALVLVAIEVCQAGVEILDYDPVANSEASLSFKNAGVFLDSFFSCYLG
jgi:hypothetical protein